MYAKIICARCGKEIERHPPDDNGMPFPEDAIINIEHSFGRKMWHTYHRECYKAFKEGR